MQQAIDILDEMIKHTFTKPEDPRTDAQIAILEEAKSRIQALPYDDWEYRLVWISGGLNPMPLPLPPNK